MPAFIILIYVITWYALIAAVSWVLQEYVHIVGWFSKTAVHCTRTSSTNTIGASVCIVSTRRGNSPVWDATFVGGIMWSSVSMRSLTVRRMWLSGLSLLPLKSLDTRQQVSSHNITATDRPQSSSAQNLPTRRGELYAHPPQGAGTLSLCHYSVWRRPWKLSQSPCYLPSSLLLHLHLHWGRAVSCL